MTTDDRRPGTLTELKLDNVQPCYVVNHVYVPFETPVAGAMPLLGAMVARSPTLGGDAITATTNAFGARQVNVLAALPTDGGTCSIFALAQNDFKLSQLFKNLKCPHEDWFIFDDVKVIVKEKQGNNEDRTTLIFSGVLRLNQPPLSFFSSFLGLSDGLLVGAELDITGQTLTDKIEVEKILLASAASFEHNLTDTISLNELIFSLQIEPASINDDNWSIQPLITGSMDISNLGTAITTLNCTMEYIDQSLKGIATLDEARGLFGLHALPLNDLQVAFTAGQQKDFVFTARINSAERYYDLSGIITEDYAGLVCHISQFDLNALARLFATLFPRTIILPDFEVDFQTAVLAIASNDCFIDGIDIERGVSLIGEFDAFGHTISSNANLTNRGIHFNGSTTDLELGPVCIKNTHLAWQLHTRNSGKSSEFTLVGDSIIESLHLTSKLSYEKHDGQWTGVVYAAIDASSFGLADIIPTARDTFLDTLKFSNATFIYASKELSTTDPDYAFRVRDGLQLIGILEEVPALSDLTGRKQIGLELSAHYGAVFDIRIAMPDTRGA